MGGQIIPDPPPQSSPTRGEESYIQRPAPQHPVGAAPLARRRFDQREPVHRPCDGGAAINRRRTAGIPQQRHVWNVRPPVETEFSGGYRVLQRRDERLQSLRASARPGPQDAVVSPIFKAIHGQIETTAAHRRAESLQRREALARKVAEKYQRKMNVPGRNRPAAALAPGAARDISQCALDLGRGPHGKKQPCGVSRPRYHPKSTAMTPNGIQIRKNGAAIRGIC